jgi:hypothetical protein
VWPQLSIVWPFQALPCDCSRRGLRPVPWMERKQCTRLTNRRMTATPTRLRAEQVTPSHYNHDNKKLRRFDARNPQLLTAETIILEVTALNYPTGVGMCPALCDRLESKKHPGLSRAGFGKPLARVCARWSAPLPPICGKALLRMPGSMPPSASLQPHQHP